MFDKIVYISDQSANIKLKDPENLAMNLMNLHLVFEDGTKKVLGEVDDMNGDIVKASFLGEIVGNKFVGGTIRKPALDAKIRVIAPEEIELITGKDEAGYMKLGYTPFYDGYQVYLDVNSFFSSHFAIFGNSGSGKSCGTTRLFQNMFQDKRLFPYKSNIILFDSSGEYFNELYDLYNGLLTDKQREYFEDYYFNNLSFSEMAENYDVSRNAIFKQLHITTDKLKEYEEKLELLKKKKKLEEIASLISDNKLKEEIENLF